MDSKPMKTVEEKKQRKLNEFLVPDDVGDTIGLNEAARMLHQKAPVKGTKPDVRRILDGLQQDRLASGFFVSPIVWVAIPSGYWIHVTEKQFKVIRDNKKGKGAYLVRLQNFAMEYASAVTGVAAVRHSNNKSPSASILVETLAAADKTFEARLFVNSAWDQYQQEMLDRAIDNAPFGSAKMGSGAKEKQSWKLVYRVLTSHLIASGIKSKEEAGTLKDLAQYVAGEAISLSEGKLSLPGQKAITDEITLMFDLLARPKK